MQRGFSAIIGIISVVMILAVAVGASVFLLSQQPKGQQPVVSSQVALNQHQAEQSIKSKIPLSTLKSPLKSSIPQGYQQFENALYTIVYPGDWQSTASTSAQLQMTEFKPKTSTDDYPSLTITVIQNSRAGTDQDMAASLIQLHLAHLPTELSGIGADLYTGTLPVKMLLGNVENTPTQQTSILVKRNGQVFMLDYKYVGGGLDESLEKTKRTMLTNFHFK